MGAAGMLHANKQGVSEGSDSERTAHRGPFITLQPSANFPAGSA